VYKYDAFGNRVEKDVIVSGVTTTQRYAYDGWNPDTPAGLGNVKWEVFADLDGSNNLQTRYLRGDHVDQLFARIASSGTAAWLLTDHLGSVVGVTDNSGVLQDAIQYDGYGNITSESAASWGGRYKFTGRELDIETGLQYNRARYYDASTGRWTSQDPLGFAAGDSNLYRYVNNVPTKIMDPSGKGDMDPVWDWLARKIGPKRILESPILNHPVVAPIVRGDPIGGATDGETYVPVWGTLRNAAYHFKQGNAGLALWYSTLTSVQIVGIAYGGYRLGYAGLRLGYKFFGRGGHTATVESATTVAQRIANLQERLAAARQTLYWYVRNVEHAPTPQMSAFMFARITALRAEIEGLDAAIKELTGG
jgi:RHS repeat-associated protein